MSTNIHNAFRLQNVSYAELNRLIFAFRAAAEPAAYDILAREAAKQAGRRIDQQALGLGSQIATPNHLSYVWNKIQDDWKDTKKNGYRHPDTDIECEISFMAAGDYILGMVITEQKPLYKLWMEISGAEEFSYWDGSDPPAGVSEDDWAARGELWDIAMPSGIPMKSGLSFTLVGTYLQHIDHDKIAAVQPSLEDRAKWAATIQLQTEYQDKPADDAPMSEFVGSCLDALEKIKTPEGQAHLALVVAEITPKLKPVLTKVDLLGWDPEATLEIAP